MALHQRHKESQREHTLAKEGRQRRMEKAVTRITASVGSWHWA